MNRTVDWAEWRTRRAAMAGTAARLSECLATTRRSGSSVKRDEADAAIITRMVRVEVARRRDEGRLVRLGEREYELHPRIAAPRQG